MFRLSLLIFFNHHYFYCLLLALLFCTHVSARNTVPEWFFNIKPDEYVGVSLPEIDTRFADVQRDLALLAAGIQKMLPSKDTYQYERALFSDGMDSRWKSMRTYKDSIKFLYSLEDHYINDIGEEFIKITTGTGDECNICVVFQQDTDWNGNGSFEILNRCFFNIQRRSDSETNIYLTYKYNQSQGQLTFVDKIELSIYSVSSKNEYEFVYDLESKKTYHYPDCGHPSNICRTISCDNALFISFINTFFRSIDGQRIYPTGIKDNHLYYLSY